MIRRIRVYKDYLRTILIKITCFYAHRLDNLVLRRRYPFEHKIIEDFAPGFGGEKEKTYHPKQIVEIEGVMRKIV